MGFFDSVGEAGRGLGAAAKDAAKTAQLNVRLKELDNKLHKEYDLIGQKYYRDHPDEDTPEHHRIREINAEIASTKDQLADIRGESVCPVCGEYVEKNAKFCSHCGADLTTTVDEDDVVEEAFEDEDEPEKDAEPQTEDKPEEEKED